jgi:carbamate kinase
MAMQIVVALGGNALMQRGQPLTPAHQLANIEVAASQLARLALHHRLVLTHGNGPQVGLLALQAMVGEPEAGFPLDVLGAQTEGMLGYLLEQALANRLPAERSVATLLTRVEVDLHDAAFDAPSKPIGPLYGEVEACRMALARRWSVAPDGASWRRVVASPQPLRVLGLENIRWLLAQGVLVIAAGGGGIPVARQTATGQLQGVEAVIDKDACSSLLARELRADRLVIVTDVAGVCLDWGLPNQRLIQQANPDALAALSLAAGTMAPKVAAACAFVKATGQPALIGRLDQIEAMLAGEAGTLVRIDGPGVQ